MTIPEQTASAPEGTVLEAEQRLSESLLWRLQRTFYEREGIEAWRSGSVPSYITNNPFVAKAYARVILGFMQDVFAQISTGGGALGPLDAAHPIYIIELGSGSGQLGYRLIKALLKVTKALPSGAPPFRYVMTDVTPANLDFWDAHPLLQPFIEQGVLDMAPFDATRPGQPLALRHSGRVLGPATLHNPPVVVANYFFDILPQDAFRVEGGVLQERRFTLIARPPDEADEHPADEPDLDDPALLHLLTINDTCVPTGPTYYGDPTLDRILASYQERLGDTALLMPIAAIRCLQALRTWADGRLFVLTADKGHAHEDELLGQQDVNMVTHGNSFSLMMNYHALAAYARGEGGFSWAPPRRGGSLVVTALGTGLDPEALPETHRAFEDDIERFGPDAFYSFLRSIIDGWTDPPLEALLGLLRLSEWDPYIVLQFGRTLRGHAASAPAHLKHDLRYALDRVWANDYSIGALEDLPFEIATIFQEMTAPADALRYYAHSIDRHGDHPITRYNMGLCYQHLGQIQTACDAFDHALRLDPNYSRAREARILAQAILQESTP